MEADPGKRFEVCRSYRLVAWSGHLTLFSHHNFGGARYISSSTLATTYKPQRVSSVECSCCVSWWAVMFCPCCAIFEVGVVLFGRRVAAAWNAAKFSLRHASSHLTLAFLRGFSLSLTLASQGKKESALLQQQIERRTHSGSGRCARLMLTMYRELPIH